MNTPERTAEQEFLDRWSPVIPNREDGTTFLDAWNTFFAPLRVQEVTGQEPSELSPDSLLSAPVHPIRGKGISIVTREELNEEEELSLTAADGEFFVAVRAKQGGGNRECWCDRADDIENAEADADGDLHEPGCLYLNNQKLIAHPNHFYNADDAYDPVHATFYYANNITAEQVEELRASRNAALRVMQLSGIRTAILDGTFSPWYVLSPTEAKNALLRYGRDKASDEQKAKRNTALKEALDALTAFIADGLVGRLAKGDERRLPLSIRTSTYNARYHAEAFATESGKIVEAREKSEHARRMTEEANALPDGSVLKEHLLGDYGTFDYTVTEKRGRRNVKVKQTSKRSNPIEKINEDADRALSNAQRSLDFHLPTLRQVETTLRERLAEQDTTLDAKRAEAWAAGWTGTADTLPPIPDTFCASHPNELVW